MTKELQDLAWSVLPKEFKEEVKRVANIFSRRTSGMLGGERTLADTFLNEFIDLFGRHNLTSDAEGEEMLTCDRDVVRMLYDRTDSVKVRQTLESLFGSKCLPEGEPKPAEPKLDRGQKCKIIGGKGTKELIGQIGTLTSFVPEENAWAVKLSDMSFIYLTESDLEPYTEPESNRTKESDGSQPVTDSHDLNKPTSTCTDNCSSQYSRQDFDSILKDSFAKDRRLNIAAQMLQALVCAPIISGVDPNPPAEQLAQTAFRLADALIAEAEKGGRDGEG